MARCHHLVRLGNATTDYITLVASVYHASSGLLPRVHDQAVSWVEYRKAWKMNTTNFTTINTPEVFRVADPARTKVRMVGVHSTV